MGIKNLMKLIQSVAPAAVKEITLKELMGRTIAIDASMAIYSFLVSLKLAPPRPHGHRALAGRGSLGRRRHAFCEPHKRGG